MASMQAGEKTHVVATLSNRTFKEAHCARYYNWAGPPGTFPPAIPAHGAMTFSGFGPKGAVQYDGKNTREAPISWILAWESSELCPTPGVPNKVYVMCGTKCAMDHVTEEQILAGLKNGSPEAGAMDVDSNSSVQAAIVPGNDIIPSVALTASFGLVR